MTGAELAGGDALHELRFALAEGQAVRPARSLRSRVIGAALQQRPAGRPSPRPDHVSGAEVFRRATTSLDGLLGDLVPEEWTRPAVRDLDVQGLIGHLIGVESDFGASLEGRPGPGRAEHVSSTEPAARAQRGRPVGDTRRDWSDLVSRTLALLAGAEAGEVPMGWYGITLPLDQVLVVRAFEVWIHESDIRRVTAGPPADPDAESLARMTGLAVGLLPAGVAMAGRARPGRTARLVLTGPGGGTWDVSLDPGSEGTRERPAATRVVVDAAAFCRIVGNRSDLAGARGLVSGDRDLAEDLCAGAAALALD